MVSRKEKSEVSGQKSEQEPDFFTNQVKDSAEGTPESLEVPGKENPAGNSPETPDSSIEPHRRCPRCWGGKRGYGTAQNTTGRKRYMKCLQSLTPGWDGCGHNWAVVITPVVVHHRDVDLETREGG